MAQTIKVNKLNYDEYNRPTGILAIKKPAGVSSHDVVNQVRKALQTKKVGHAGALDVFAEGVLIILVGRATKLSVQVMELDKSYRADVLVGISTETQDTEGLIKDYVKELGAKELEEVISALGDFRGEYQQYVSLYSSVKVDGRKLRKIMRDDRYRKTVSYDEDMHKYLELDPLVEGLVAERILVPRKPVKIYDLELLERSEITGNEIPFSTNVEKQIEEEYPQLKNENYPVLTIEVACSKGTYIRQLAEDIGNTAGLPAMLIKLTRTKVGEIGLDKAIDVQELPGLIPTTA